MQYGEKFGKQWAYIGQYLIDAEHGGWYEWGLDKSPDAKRDHKAHAWKAAYHDGRSLMNCLRYLRPDQTAPPAPVGVQFTRNETGRVTLHWNKSTDDRNLRGYDIYQGGKRIGFTPLTQFTVHSLGGTTAMDFAVVARDVQGNASPAASAAAKK
jgi:mannobiose 2-epimerase